MRRVVAVVALLLALATLAGPATASRGGHAAATGVDAVAGELRLDVTTSGAVESLGPLVDRLTAEPLLPGRRVTAVQAGTPPEPEGQEGDSLGPVELGSVLVVEAVRAETGRQENGVLAAEASVGGGQVELLGLSVLDVGAVTSRATTHADDPPGAGATVSGLEVFGSAVDLPQGEGLDLSLELGTDQVLDLLEDAVPGLSGVTGLLARAAGAGGTVDVTVRSETAADPDTGSARATGLVAEVSVSLHARLCVPELGGDGCVGEVAVAADARVLDLQLAHSEVERPQVVDPGVEWWAVALAVIGVAGIAVVVTAVRRTAAAQPRSR